MRRRLAVSLLVVAWLPACSRTVDRAERTPSSTTTAPDATVTPWACPSGTPESARCVRMEVPADPSSPGGDVVSLPVIVIPATTADRRPDPLVVPAGGPGGAMTEVAAYWSDPHRAIVLYDQRGTGRAEPRLECPEHDAAWLANLQRDAAFAVEQVSIADAAAACHRRLVASGIDLDDYDTESNVRDLDSIRRALGYERWNILGISYGARLALAAVRSSPDGIRSVMLDSVSDVTAGGLAASRASAGRAIAELVAGCSENDACAAGHPDLDAEIRRVEERYDAAPAVVDVAVDDSSAPARFVITGADLMAGISQAMYDAALIPLLPRIIGALAAGDTSIIPQLIRQNVAFHRSIAWGMNLSVNCADYAGLDPADDAAAMAEPGRFRTLLTETTCERWPVEPTSDTFNAPVASDIPALVVAGRFDPVILPGGSERVASRLANSTFAIWPDRGHGVTGDACAETIMATFLEHPELPPNLDCLAAISGPAFA